MTVNPGKLFESRFKTCLNRLPGASMRIEDGGKEGRSRQWGDFFYWNEFEETFLFECKATKLNRFELRKLAKHQLDDLLMFDCLRSDHHSVLAFNFYKDSTMTNNICVLVDVHDYVAWKEGTNRASLPMAEAMEIGVLCKVVDKHWDLERALYELYFQFSEE